MKTTPTINKIIPFKTINSYYPTLDTFDLYLSTPNLSIALARPNTPDETQDCLWHVVLQRKKKNQKNVTKD